MNVQYTESDKEAIAAGLPLVIKTTICQLSYHKLHSYKIEKIVLLLHLDAA